MPHKHQLLFVDDEPRVTSAMRAIFRRDYDVLIANSGSEALALMAENDINVIVSDQRMPKMLGNELLAEVSAKHPKTMRILLTGFMDRQAIVDSINEGQIYRFINKPWDNDEIRSIVADAARASESPITPMLLATPEPTLATESLVNKATVSNIDGSIHDANVQEPAQPRGLLILERQPSIRHQIRRFCAHQRVMIYATQNYKHAIAAVAQRKNIGVVVIELSDDTKTAMQLINILKRVRPDLITIALSDEYDTETAVELVNQGQVFKYLAKPLDMVEFQKSIRHGFLHHHFLKKNTAAQKRYQVETRTGTLVSGIQQLFSKLFS